MSPSGPDCVFSHSLGQTETSTRRCVMSVLRPKAYFLRLPGQVRLVQISEVIKGYSITSSAATSSVCGTVRPSAFAVLRLMTKSNLVGCSTGKSMGFAPLRILLT
jgi:hypothetical protein